MIYADRVEALEIALALFIDHLDHVGSYDRTGERPTAQVPVAGQARAVLGETAYQCVLKLLEE